LARNYQETLDYLYTRLPVFQHIGKAAYKADLNNTIALANALGNPEHSFKSIHVAGTNGKGSVSSLLASVFTAHGYKTGLYTSPHLKDFRERIRIDGEMIAESFVVEFTNEIHPVIEAISPSFFEITVAMAFDYFRREKVDIAVIETGMGGRLDSTNIVTPLLSVITNIGFDHMEFLGNTRAAIAAEKAGIIKQNIPVIIGEYDAETLPVFEEKSNHENAPLYQADTAPEAWIEHFTLKGNYQKKNLATVKKALDVLAEEYAYQFEAEKIETALKDIKDLSGIRGRWEVLQTEPMVVADTAHNEHGLKLVMEQLLAIPAKKMHVVLGVVNDKDLSKILPLFPENAVYYFAKPNIVRGLDAAILEEKAREYGLKGAAYQSVAQAFSAAKAGASKADLIFVGGSTFVVAEVI
jgi:dihydrofolate synthase/folylpolyglutamate synthase